MGFECAPQIAACCQAVVALRIALAMIASFRDIGPAQDLILISVITFAVQVFASWSLAYFSSSCLMQISRISSLLWLAIKNVSMRHL